MGRPSISLEQYKIDIHRWYIEQNRDRTMVLSLLKEYYGVSISLTLLKEKLRDWKFAKNIMTNNLPLIKMRIAALNLNHCLTDHELYGMLIDEGHTISYLQMQRTRRSLKIYRRIDNQHDRVAIAQVMFELMEDEMQNGLPAQYGRGLMYSHFQSQGINVGRDIIFSILKTIDPCGVAARRPFQRLKRNLNGRATLPGPNWVWSMDGHLKLRMFGIEIYAAIDGYSRYVLWVHVGISATTAVSVAKQYLEVVKLLGFCPAHIRTDRGTETMLMANGHWQLAQDAEPDIDFKSIYYYGTSKMNQVIEQWWSRMTKGQTRQWKKEMNYLTENNLFTGSEADLIAIAVIYIPFLRLHISNFVRTWNDHAIRKQEKSPLIDGKPFVNWRYPHVNNPGATSCERNVDLNQVENLLESVNDYDSEQLVTDTTWLWCKAVLETWDIELPIMERHILDNDLTNLQSAYIKLRTHIKKHMEVTNNTNPSLERASAPRKAYDWNSVPRLNQEEMEMENDYEEESGDGYEDDQ